MRKFKGTPGPWKVRKWSGDEWPDRRISVGPESDGIATAVCISPRYCSETQAEANARLIAAAPKLLDAAIMAIEHYDAYFGGSAPDDLPWVPVMREAIKEALREDEQ